MKPSMGYHKTVLVPLGQKNNKSLNPWNNAKYQHMVARGMHDHGGQWYLPTKSPTDAEKRLGWGRFGNVNPNKTTYLGDIPDHVHLKDGTKLPFDHRGQKTSLFRLWWSNTPTSPISLVKMYRGLWISVDTNTNAGKTKKNSTSCRKITNNRKAAKITTMWIEYARRKSPGKKWWNPKLGCWVLQRRWQGIAMFGDTKC